MKGTAILPGGPLWPDWAKAERLRIEDFYWLAIDPTVTASFIDTARARINPVTGLSTRVGILRDPSWGNYSLAEVNAGKRGMLNPYDFAVKLDNDLRRLNSHARQMYVIADYEGKDPAYMVEFLKWYRLLRPVRPLIWTPESFQGGWFSPELVKAINADRYLKVAPQIYRGDMTPRCAAGATKDLRRAGVNISQMAIAYGCATVGPDKNALGVLVRRYTNPPDDWDGYLYDFINVRG